MNDHQHPTTLVLGATGKTGRRVAERLAARGLPDVAVAALRFEPIPMEAFTAAMADAGEPDEVVELTAYLFREVLDGRNESVTDGVQRALGRPARDFADYACDAAATGVWS